MAKRPENEYDPRHLQMVHTTLLVAQILFWVVTGFMLYYKTPALEESVGFLPQIVAAAVALLLDYAGAYLFWNWINNPKPDGDLDERLRTLTRAHLVRWAFVEAATLLLLATAIIFPSTLLFWLAAVNIIYFYLLKPRLFDFENMPAS